MISNKNVLTKVYRDYGLIKKIFDSILDDLSDAKNKLADMNRRLHELELELRRLENEREELAAAYKEAEAVSEDLSWR